MGAESQALGTVNIAIPRLSAEIWIASGGARAQTRTFMRCQHHEQEFNILCHSAGPRNIDFFIISFHDTVVDTWVSLSPHFLHSLLSAPTIFPHIITVV